MKIMIGGQDYTSALDAAHPLTIERKLNEPSVCQLWITLPPGSSSTIARNQYVLITGDNETCYFTGYIAATPLLEYAGLALEGPQYRLAIHAVSDECLLDQAGMAPSRELPGMNAGPLIAALVAKTASTSLSTDKLSLDAPVAFLPAEQGASFSATAAKAANAARSAYRALNGALTLSSIPAAVHKLSEADGTLALENFSLTATAKRALANDITVCGEHEPTAYITEYFLGDGITTQFNLSENVFTPPASKSTLIRELFNEGQIDLRLWGNPGTHNYLSLGSGGLVMQGGTGKDGETQLTWRDPIEMGGTLLLEVTGVTLANGSSGILAGFFVGDKLQQACTAGFQVTAQQGAGAVSLQPLVLGSPAGSAYPVNPSNQYALRVRVHCPECERGTGIYRSFGDSGPIAAGGDRNTAPGSLQFEIQEFVNGVAGMPVTLYEGTIASLPGTCTALAASSTNLYGSMRGLNLTNLGSGWAVTAPPNGSPTTRRLGAPTQSAECAVESGGRLVFYPGFTPVAGEQIAVSYRAVGRAVGRAVNTSSQQQLADSGLPPVSAWIGTVTNPPARSSQSCRNAALALEQAAASVSALWGGTFKCSSADLEVDLWPGDALDIDAPSAGLDAELIIRSVKLTYTASCPDVVQYTICFANDWADDLAIQTGCSVPADAWLPVPISPVYAPNLSGLAVIAMGGGTVTINTGAAPPIGGGFEIRRADNCFMTGTDTDLVMRSSQPTMTFSRLSAWDRFFIRAYDASIPPNYSEFSAALIFNIPLAS
jgi:hypothetical protein